jgi:hypothetical protein
MAYDRYKFFKNNADIKYIPFINIAEQSTDIKVIYTAGISRLDKLSQKYYADPTFGWLILQANAQYGGIEFDFPDDVVIRIPYPLESAILLYETEVTNYFAY